MRRRKPTDGFILCGVFCWTIIAHLVSTCLAAQLEERMEIVRKVLKEVPLIDGHNDLPWNIRKFLKNQLREFRFGEDLRDITPWSTSAWSHTDLRRLKEGMVSAQFWSAYAPCSSQHLDAVQLTLEQIDLIRRLVSLYPQHMALVTTADGIEESHRSGKLASLIGIEGGHSIGTSLGVLRTFYQLGARYLTLTHTCNTPWADCCKVDEPGRVPHIGGLSHFGTLVVTEMNRLGMIVDLSHVSVPTMLDALATSKAPVIFSHSSAHAICNSSRNVPDHVLKRIVSAVPLLVLFAFSISRDRFPPSGGVPQGLEDVSRYPYLFAELLESERWTEEDIAKLAGRNLIRVFRQVEQVRDQLEAQGMLPIDQSIPPEDILGRSYCRYSGPRT
uniref:Dipeptidase n=1 Tax=Anopheles coluzzii TaxID=1518534 RepID=A0A8W7PSW9_ANOCL